MRSAVWLSLVLGLFAPVASAQQTTVLDDGTAVIDTAVACGEHEGRVLVNTGVHYRASSGVERTSGVSISFKSASESARDCCWLQFVWMELIATYETPTGLREVRVATTLDTPGGEVVLTTDPTRPRWRVGAGGPNPCYEAQGEKIRSPAETRIFDQPGDGATLMGPFVPLPQGTTRLVRVEDRKHFQTYLVCDHRVCFVVTWEQRHVWEPPRGGTGATSSGPRYEPTPSGEPATSVAPGQRTALGDEHPGQKVLR